MVSTVFWPALKTAQNQPNSLFRRYLWVCRQKKAPDNERQVAACPGPCSLSERGNVLFRRNKAGFYCIKKTPALSEEERTGAYSLNKAQIHCIIRSPGGQGGREGIRDKAKVLLGRGATELIIFDWITGEAG